MVVVVSTGTEDETLLPARFPAALVFRVDDSVTGMVWRSAPRGPYIVVSRASGAVIS
jgi:hypothetical protein